MLKKVVTEQPHQVHQMDLPVMDLPHQVQPTDLPVMDLPHLVLTEQPVMVPAEPWAVMQPMQVQPMQAAQVAKAKAAATLNIW